ncbi:MAG: dihydrolipoyl dehydrogenase [Verrucomicrobia bacterium]|nr:dihydrolipoyl dehydrogenase [Verrucomicrobiota bacterium]
MKPYDVIVVGTGGGSKITHPAVRAGLSVAVVDKGPVGGTCLNRGCIPSKMLIYPAEVADIVREAGRFGLSGIAPPRADLKSIVRRINEKVDGQSAAGRRRYDTYDSVDFYDSPARFVSDRVLDIRGELITADTIFLATGARPAIPAIPGLLETPFMSSTEALRNETLPQSLIVIGAGYIGTELGYAYGALGTKVQFIVRSRFLRNEDREIADAFDDVFSASHQVHKGMSPTSIEHDSSGFTVTCQNATGESIQHRAEALLVATGIVPETDDLGLENTGIQTNAQGYIQVNDHLQTSVPGIYALGDCIGRHFFRHTVNHEGEYLVRRVIDQTTDAPIDYGPVPHAIFTHPQVAGVGPTEQDLIAAGASIVVGRAKYPNTVAGSARLLDHGLVKLLIDRNDGTILGCHIVGPEASNMIHLVIALMKLRGRLTDLLDMIFIHPALPEVIRDAARDARDQLPACRP